MTVQLLQLKVGEAARNWNRGRRPLDHISLSLSSLHEFHEMFGEWGRKASVSSAAKTQPPPTDRRSFFLSSWRGLAVAAGFLRAPSPLSMLWKLMPWHKYSHENNQTMHFRPFWLNTIFSMFGFRNMWTCGHWRVKIRLLSTGKYCGHIHMG